MSRPTSGLAQGDPPPERIVSGEVIVADSAGTNTGGPGGAGRTGNLPVHRTRRRGNGVDGTTRDVPAVGTASSQMPAPLSGLVCAPETSYGLTEPAGPTSSGVAVSDAVRGRRACCSYSLRPRLHRLTCVFSAVDFLFLPTPADAAQPTKSPTPISRVSCRVFGFVLRDKRLLIFGDPTSQRGFRTPVMALGIGLV